MENKVLKLGMGGGGSTKDVYAEIRQGNSERWTIQSQKSKYVNGKRSGVLKLVILLASIPRTMFWRKTRVTILFRLLHLHPGNFDMLSWSCLDKNGNAFSPNYNLPSNSYFTTKTTGLGSYTLTKVSTPSASSDTPILSSRFNPPKKYPLDLNFYWVTPT